MYVLLMAGAWTFVNSCGNSYSRLAGEKIVPASLVVSDSKADISILGHKVTIDTSSVRNDSKIYSALYIASPDELRAVMYLVSFADEL